ncbi:MAG: hypothetical protein QOG99_2182, partial [Frankiales bacterium]|nr:hypothetical protein [Frankiales bacterium]
MSRTSQALKRLGVGSVSAVTVLAMPYVGVSSAFAAAGDPPVTSITSQTNGASPRNDGTDTTVKISANVAYQPVAAPGANPNAPTAVTFSYAPSAGSDVVIGTDTTAPYSIAWTPPVGGGAFTLKAQALSSTSAPIGNLATKATTVADAPSVHIVSPAEGDPIGMFGGKIIVSGTRSADFPALSVTAQSRDNGLGTLSAAGAATAVPATT